MVDQQRQQLIDFIARVLAQQTDKRNATRMARHCMLLFDGAIVAAQTRGRTGAAMEAWNIARQWLSATDASRKLA
ncbi:hypothetical protein KPG66_08970 [Mycetohabitans sp. B2]|uniref:hypothetical protein n=1 Tax=Mycetohabitans sp. B2 TaxID=2841274 RepID=UPI001F2EA577|nr:hypothetical protein [Mycetohabitans sp. B2]MCF7696218.1 hypothetical protein [Mycetohabitans sp. B2]